MLIQSVALTIANFLNVPAQKISAPGSVALVPLKVNAVQEIVIFLFCAGFAVSGATCSAIKQMLPFWFIFVFSHGFYT